MGNNSVIVVHAGRRDDYQVALGLYEQNLLGYLVTDVYFPIDTRVYKGIRKILSNKIKHSVNKRYKQGLPSKKVQISYIAFFYSVLYRLTNKVCYSKKKDEALGKLANKLSLRGKLPVLSMNTYAQFAFSDGSTRPKFLFQFHPHARFVKRLLESEIDRNPYAAESLRTEYEFSLDDDDLNALSNEAQSADYIICASSITKQSLVENNINSGKIKVIPYGVDHTKFPFYKKAYRSEEGNFKVLFIGSLNQRKGITYLLEAMNGVPNMELIIIGRGIFDLGLLLGYDVKCQIYKDIPLSEMVSVMHQCHCFVLPSIIEGFGQVIIEAMATGLPVIATENTIAKDIIENGKNGFVVPIMNSAAIHDYLLTLINDPDLIDTIGTNAYRTSIELTWEKFRREIAEHVKNILTTPA